MESNLPPVAVIGMGNLGTALAHWLAHNTQVISWAHSQQVADEINNQHTNTKYLTNFDLHPNLTATTDLSTAINSAQILFLTLPARHIYTALSSVRDQLNSVKIIVNTSKGMDAEQGIPVYDHVTQLVGGSAEVIQLAGPMLANEFVRGSKTLGILTKPHRISREVIKQLFHHTPMDFEFTTDIQGVVWGAILKNLYAIGWGMLSLLAEDNMNLKGIYITKAFAEMTLIAHQEGAFTDTLFGLAGLGDFVATSLSSNSHNRQYGYDFAAGLERTGDTLPEGYFNLQGIAKRYQYQLQDYPLLDCLNKIIFESQPSQSLIERITS